jgi:hypothetical protein
LAASEGDFFDWRQLRYRKLLSQGCFGLQDQHGGEDLLTILAEPAPGMHWLMFGLRPAVGMMTILN